MALHVTVGYGDEGGTKRTEQEVLTPLGRTTTYCVVMSAITVVLASPHRRTLADRASLQAALVVVPVTLVLAAARLTRVTGVSTRQNSGVSRPNLLR